MNTNDVSLHCLIPEKPSKVVSAPSFQSEYKKAKNKGQQLRVCLRTLSSMGYLSNADPALREKVREYLEDYD